MKNKSRAIQSILFMVMLVCTAFLPGMMLAESNENHANEEVNINVVSNTDEEIIISYDVNNYNIELEEIDGSGYHRYTIDDESNTMIPGFPEVPNIRRSIIIPNDKKMEVQIISKEVEQIDNIDIIPSKGILPRSISPDDVPYTFDDIYSNDTWYPSSYVELDEPYILRDFRAQVIQINPIQYNPAQHRIRLINSIEVKVYPTGPGEINVIQNDEPLDSLDVTFKTVYSHHFLNYEEVISNAKYPTVPEIGNMLVITYDDFYDEMIPFVEWKNMKGIPTEMVNVSVAGSTADEIADYISDYYNTTGLTFVLLVGDISQIPSMDTPNSAHCSDPMYAYIVGGDYYQDIFVGRFSAQTSAQVNTQVDRSIAYEQNPETSGSWYHKGVGIGSPEGTGDDDEYDWEHIRNIKNLLEGFTYSFVDEFYGGSQGGDDADGEPENSDVVAALDDGRSILNHCGHGAWDGIGWSANPGWSVLENSDVNSLTNDYQLPFVVLVACDSGDFENYDSCFAETWLRATNDATGDPTGAIGCFASTQSQSWAPPMEGQDEIIDLLVNESFNTMGGLCYTGTMSMTEEYSAYDETDTWTLFGDPSLQIRTDIPGSLTVDHDDSVMEGSIELEVIVSGVEGALCAVSHNGVLLGYDYTDASGVALISFAEPLADMDVLDLVVTAFNMQTYQAMVDVSPPLGNIAEFNPMQGVLINYGGNDAFMIPLDLIAEMSEDVVVCTIVDSSAQQATVDSLFDANGVDPINREYLIAPSDSEWTRDYGPWFRYNHSINQLEVIDFEYNRPRPDDDNIPNEFANFYAMNAVYMDIIHAGGNYMTDGDGISASTTLVFSENPSMTEEEIQDMFAEYLGIQTYHLYPDPLGEYIEHIDCWAKFLSPDSVMVIEVDPSHSNYADIEAAADWFANQVSSTGDFYEVHRVYCHLDEAYVNSLILNDKVLVPVSGSVYDDDAIAAYEAAMPGYEVLGFTGSWQNTDALHCRVKGIPDMDMVAIDHDELIDQMPNDQGFEVSSDILSYMDARSVVNATVHWKNSSVGVWNMVSMIAEEDTYTGFIPNHPCGESISYYISAENGVGDVFFDPFVGVDDPYDFDITLVPDIWVDPLDLDFMNSEGILLSKNVTIGNDEFAGEILHFNVSCTDGDGYNWLSTYPMSGSIIPGERMNITAMVNTTNIPVGNYAESIIITSDDPDEPLVTVGVNLTIVHANDFGVVSINEPSGILPAGSYLVNATVENIGSSNQTNVEINCSIRELGGQLFEDFEANNGGFSHAVGPGPGSIDDWEWGSPSSGPDAAYSGSYCWATNLDGHHSNGSDSVLDSVPVNLALYGPDPVFSFWHWYDHTVFDCGNLKISVDGGSTWDIIYPQGGYPGTASSGNQGISGEPAFTDVSNGWEKVVFNLSDYEMQTVLLRWHFGSTTSVSHPGWYIDDMVIESALNTRGPGDLVYWDIETIDLNAYENTFVEFTPSWDASVGNYSIQVTTNLFGDQDLSNDMMASVINIVGPTLSFSPKNHDFGTMMDNASDSVVFEIWNGGIEQLNYNLSESCDWITVSPLTGDSTGEHDSITVEINTTDLDAGQSYSSDVNITSNGGNDVFSVSVFVINETTPLEDLNQSVFDRGFPIRHAVDGDWAGAQDFSPTIGMISKVCLYARVFGTPEFDLTIELRQDGPQGTLLDSVSFTPSEVPSSWTWLEVDFSDVVVQPGTDYFIVCPPAPNGVTTSFGYEWGYAFGDLYLDGSFWFTRDGGGLWRDLPTMYEFTFKTFGYI